MIFTFYSFKGGVGRSMMLANTAELLCQRGLNVLMVDFDLEAPGLERFFSRPEDNTLEPPVGADSDSLPSHSELVGSRGVMDLLISYKTLQALPLPEPASKSPNIEEDGDGVPEAPSFPFHVEPLGNFVKPIRRNAAGGSLSLMTAGRRDNNEFSLYAERVRAFDWDEFYVQWHGAQFFEWFAKQVDDGYDAVLIDSRTGITEMSGVCTHQLADAVVLFVAANEQNLEGTQRIAASLSRPDMAERRGGRDLSVLIVPSRVELAEGTKLGQFSEKFKAMLAGMIDKRITFHTSAFLDLRVPYIPYYAFGEGVAMREPDLPIAADMVAATTRICSAMVELVPKDSPIYRQYQVAGANLPTRLETAAFAKPPTDFAGREWVFEAIEQWLTRDASPTMLVVGGPGSGKTAIAARLVAAADKGETLAGTLRPARQLALAHSCRPEEGWRSFLEAMVRALAAQWPAYVVAVARSAAAIKGITLAIESRISGIQGPPGTSGSLLQSIEIEDVSLETAFTVLVQQPLYDVAHSNATGLRPALVLADGIDEVLASDRETAADLLATAVRLGWPGQMMKLLILSRPDTRVLRMSDNVIELDGDPEAAKPDIVSYATKRFAGRLEPQELEVATDRLAEAATGNFLYAVTVLNAALENAGDSAAILANLEKALQPGQIPPALHARYVDMIQQEVRFDTEKWAERYRPVLGVLAVAPEGFTPDELAGITGRRRSDISDDLRLMQKLVVVAQNTRQVRLFHRSFAIFLLFDNEYGVSAVEAHEMIAAYFVGQYSGQWGTAPEVAVRDTDRYLLQAIDEATDRRKGRALADSLAALLLDVTFVEAKLARNEGTRIRAGIATLVYRMSSNDTHFRELTRLDVLLRDGDREVLAKMRGDRQWLPAQLAASDAAVSPTDLQSPPITPDVSEPMPASPPPTPADFVTDDMLRRQIPMTVRVALKRVNNNARTGAILLALSLLLTGVVVAGRPLINYNLVPYDLLVGAYAITLLAAGYLSWTAWYDRTLETRHYAGVFWRAGDDKPSGDWEQLPEIIALQTTRRPYHILGGVSAGSPYFEIALVLFIIGALIGTLSSPVDLLRLLTRSGMS